MDHKARQIRIRRKVSSSSSTSTSNITNNVNTRGGHNENHTNNISSITATAKGGKRPQPLRQKLNITSPEFVSNSDNSSDAGSDDDSNELPKIILPPNDTTPPIGQNGLYTRWNSVNGEWEETPSNSKTRQIYNVNRLKKRHASSPSPSPSSRIKQDVYYNDSYIAPAHRPPRNTNKDGGRMWWNRATKTWSETLHTHHPLTAPPPEKVSQQHQLHSQQEGLHEHDAQQENQPPPPPPDTDTLLPPPPLHTETPPPPPPPSHTLLPPPPTPPPQTKSLPPPPPHQTTEDTHVDQPTPPEMFYTKPPRKNAKKELVCSTCQKKCLSKRDLVLHMNVHLSRDEQVLRFSCPVCLRKFSTKQSLKFHLPTHTKERPHKCNVCNDAFSHPKTLRLHKLKHEDPKFSCDECSKKFRYRQVLERHLASHMRALLPRDKFKVTDKGVVIPIPPTPEGPPPP